jgi:sulfonate transport system ATP-binding protein
MTIVQEPDMKRLFAGAFHPDAMVVEVGGGPLLDSEAVARRPVATATQTARRRGVCFRADTLTRQFGATRVLEGLSLSAAAGEFVAVIGRSGCGKSTFLRMLAGLDAPDGGAIAFDDDARARRSDDVRVMFQEPRLLPWRNLLYNVLIGLGEEARRTDLTDAALAALDAVGLRHRADAWPASLSGGQRQRVALARALVSGPGVLALDEPFGALDALTKREMHALLDRVWREQGFTAVMVTHDVAEAVALADRVVLFEDGRVTLDLTIDAARPRQRFDPHVAGPEQEILRRLTG